MTVQGKFLSGILQGFICFIIIPGGVVGQLDVDYLAEEIECPGPTTKMFVKDVSVTVTMKTLDPDPLCVAGVFVSPCFWPCLSVDPVGCAGSLSLCISVPLFLAVFVRRSRGVCRVSLSLCISVPLFLAVFVRRSRGVCRVSLSLY